MKKLILFLALVLGFCVSGNSQALNSFRGTLNVFGFSGTGPNYNIQGFFNDSQGNWVSSDVQVGDILYMSTGSFCSRFLVNVINSSAGSIIDADVIDIDGVTSVFPGGIGALMRETSNFDYPTFTDDISDDLQSCVRTHFTLLVDQTAGGSGITVTDGNTVDLTLVLQDLTAEVIISPDADNITEARVTGIYTPAPVDINVATNKPIYCANDVGAALDVLEDFAYELFNTNSITLTLTDDGDPCSPEDLTADVNISADAGNAVEIRGDGLYVSATNVFTYRIGVTNAVVRASAQTVTYVQAAGVGTLSIPAGVTVYDVSINGATADLDGNNDFTLVVDYALNTDFNTITATTLDDFFPPLVQVINDAAVLGGGPTPAAPFIYDEGSAPQIRVVALGGGDVSVLVNSLDAFSNWTIRAGL